MHTSERCQISHILTQYTFHPGFSPLPLSLLPLVFSPIGKHQLLQMGGSGSRERQEEEVEQPDDQSQQLSDEAIQLMQAMEQQEEKAREALELQVERACLPLAEAAADVTRRARQEDKRTDLALQAGLAAAASRANRETESLRQEVQAIKDQWANTRRSHKRRRSRSSSADSISSRSKSRTPPELQGLRHQDLQHRHHQHRWWTRGK